MFRTIRLTCVLALGAWLLPAQTAAVNTVGTTGMAGLASGQTARMNVLNVATPSTATAAICTAAVSFLDDNGAVLKSATVTVAPGKSAKVDLHSDTDLSLA